MKTKLRFINGLVTSPIVEIEHNDHNRLHIFLTTFVKSLNNADPNKTMIDFIAAALKTSGRVYRFIPISISAPKQISTDVLDISIREANIVEFVYHKDDGSSSWRKVDVIEEDSHYIKGNDVDDDLKFKCFKKSLIVGGRVIRQSKK